MKKIMLLVFLLFIPLMAWAACDSNSQTCPKTHFQSMTQSLTVDNTHPPMATTPFNPEIANSTAVCPPVIINGIIVQQVLVQVAQAQSDNTGARFLTPDGSALDCNGGAAIKAWVKCGPERNVLGAAVRYVYACQPVQAAVDQWQEGN